MPTVNQLIRKGRGPRGPRGRGPRSTNLRGLGRSPQKKGVCVKVFVANPKKPNSANRKVARVKLSNKFFITCLIPGEGHNLQKYSTVLVKGGRVRDLPGVRYKAVRGVYDLSPVKGRKRGRSLYGAPTAK